MKFLTVQKVVLLFFICLLVSCINDDEPDNCKVNNEAFQTKIAFQCLSDSTDVFEQEIINNKSLSNGGTVTLYVYDKATGNYVYERVVSNTALKNFKGITLSLEPGVYEIRCWANMSTQSVVFNEEKLTTARLTNVKQYPNQQIVTSDDPLYYGATTLTVPNKGFDSDVIADTISFRTAHLHFNIEFVGSGRIIPKIEIRNLDPTYDFEMQKVGSSISYFPEIKIGTRAASIFMKAEFNILRTAYKNVLIEYDNTDNIEIVVKDTRADTLVYSIGLKNWLDKYGIKINSYLDNNFISMPDSLRKETSGLSSLPSFVIELGDSLATPVDTIPNPIDTIPNPIDTIPNPIDTIPNPIDTIPNPIDTIPNPIDTIPDPIDPIPVPPTVPDISEQGLFFHLYRYTEGIDLFGGEIESVNVYIYEKKSGNLFPIPKDVLSGLDFYNIQGLQVPLPPINQLDTASREYEIRCWGNVGTNTKVSNQHHLVSASVANINYGETDTIRTNDKLYFGQTSVRVTSDYTYATGKVNFNAAYTQYAISVKGLGAFPDLPKIKVTGLPSSYDFYMDDQQWESKPYYPDIKIVGRDTMFLFNSFRLTNQNLDKVKITLEHPSLNTTNNEYTINLMNRDIMLDDKKSYNYIYVKGVNTLNTIRVNFNIGSGIFDEVW